MKPTKAEVFFLYLLLVSNAAMATYALVASIYGPGGVIAAYVSVVFVSNTAFLLYCGWTEKPKDDEDSKM